MTKDEALDLALEALEHMLEDAKQERLTVEYWNECVDAITAIKQARALDKMAENARELGLDYEPVQTDWEAVAADQAMTIAIMKAQLEGLPGKEQLPWFKDEIPAAYMYDRARYGPTDLRGQQWLPELSRLKPYTGDGRVRGLRPLYTHPIAQTWAGLTDEQMAKALPRPWPEEDDRVCLSPTELRQFAQAIEAALGIKE